MVSSRRRRSSAAIFSMHKRSEGRSSVSIDRSHRSFAPRDQYGARREMERMNGRSRAIMEADKLTACGPGKVASASAKPSVESPFRQRPERAPPGSVTGAHRAAQDRRVKCRRSSARARLSRTRGMRTATGPNPVMIARSGRWPWRTGRAPLRSASLSESVKAPSLDKGTNVSVGHGVSPLRWRSGSSNARRRLTPHAVTNFRE